MMVYQAYRNTPVPETSVHPFQSVPRTPSLSDKVAEQLTEAIVSKQIRAGERLPSERELSDQFKVSRTVIREAVRSLAARGLVRVTSGRGVEVNEFGSGGVAASMRLLVRGHEGLDYGKVNEVRTAVEVQVAGLAAQRARPQDLERLRQICDGHQRSLEQGDLVGASELDFQFHRELTRCADNELLLAMLDSVGEVLREIRHQSMTEPHVGEEGLRAHRRILKSVSSGNPQAARDAMSDHLAEAERVWLGAKARGDKVTARKKKLSGK
jgi:GntR family transcriptional regulator, transcriptional repressor for pyruvate dehydrogenase complex